ncbi:IKI3 family protein [Ascosphaera apis ARSEF 7405]|uniref:Elongator complex protein 1 n=1 Tax=Ascosphaera apis ARSEF 7405 TaxID=392613 RepID=A0A168AA25_9EURO|nr:IKI3 family protein [Ascosphaera apis ARSEF 7405]
MRNLRPIHVSEVHLAEELPLTATAWDSATDSLICAFGPSQHDAIIELKRRDLAAEENSFTSIASWDAPSPLPDLPFDRIVSLTYFSDTLTTCLVLEGGDIVVVRDDPQAGEDQIEIVGSVDAGITGAAWTPDEELLAVTTRADTLLFMTRDFQGVADVTLTSEDLNASRHVSVGWGKKETQFEGKGAKAMKDPTIPDKVDEGLRSPNDDGRTVLSWRGDGSYLAINSLQATYRRVIRVYSREGVLDSVSEPVDYIESALSWKPSGNLIASIQRLQDRIDVIFFERNGLRHGQFQLPLTKEEAKSWAANISLAWNIDSSVLAVIFKDRVQLWTMDNYHYYLKQEIPLTADGSDKLPISCFKWHQEKALRCVVSSAKTVLFSYWVFDVIRGSTTSPYDFGVVAVIDGKILRLTALRMATVSPPMAGHEVLLKENAIDVSFSISGRRFVVLSESGITLYNWSLNKRPTPDPQLSAFFPFDNTQVRYTRVAFLGEKKVFSIGSHSEGGTDLRTIDLVTKEVSFQSQPLNKRQIVSIFPDVNHKYLCYQWRQGKDQGFGSTETGIIQDGVSHFTPLQEITHAALAETPSGDSIPFMLSKSGSLFAGERLLAKNCTSFLLTSKHLVYTTTLHLLKFVHITNVNDLEIPDDTPETDERCRSVERGARLISIVPSSFIVTLQMPRGNLENVYPRALTLAGIRGYIDNKNYLAAYLACRSQIVDMNILHDHHPEQFMSNIALFIDQVQKIEYIDEFLSRLSNEDVTQTLYKDTLRSAGGQSVTNTIATTNNKVNKICDGFISVLLNRIDSNLQNLVTAHVCKSPPDLEAGLALVIKLREKSVEQAEEAVEHMCFLTDAHRLYNYALGSYDLELTLMVAQQAQRDPREYLPFLQKLQEMPEMQRKYEIDNYLNRHARALQSLHALHAYDDLKRYAIKHSLYNEALELYKYQPELLREMSEIYADYLYETSNYKEAALAYESLDMFEPAYKAYNLAHLWQECLYCASLVPLSDGKLRELAASLATVLVDEEHDYVSAALIHAQYLNDIPQAARLLCRGSQFGDACRLLTLHKMAGLVPEVVDPAIGEAMGSMIDLLADCKSQLNKQIPRIHELRALRKADPLGFYGGDSAMAGADGIDIPDNVSLAPTDATTATGKSMFTRYTGGTMSSRKTSKTRRREERKRARGKKGTVYEEEYLVNSVRRLIERVNRAIGEVDPLLQALLRRKMRERAVLVQKHMDELVTMCRDCIDDVFEVEKTPESENETETLGVRPAGAEGVLWDTLEGRNMKGREPPTVKPFKRLSLLGA